MAVLAMTAGCAGKADAGGQSGARRTPAVTNARDFGAADLERTVLTAKDVPVYRVTRLKADKNPSNPAPGVEPAVCRPIAHRIGSADDARSIAGDVRVVVAKDHSGAATLSLSFFTAADARAAMDELRAALGRCTAYEIPAHVEGGAGVPVSEVRAGSGHGALGDESLSYTDVTGFADDPDTKIPGLRVVVRVGNAIVSFRGSNLDQEPATVPDDLVAAQLAKLAEGTA
ncbi:hypothetical protein [Streptomyces sp. GC420]|uniref:hypothetical protein n=1 Tax=Streptomyces sp. GC420 TaxID=2697568 RepID=UPI001414F3B0|nr:hypothetical protein [Streptomyces sp. GC420]NBM16419.1 hypothetical protein [Streptomyces sp. GC420]